MSTLHSFSSSLFVALFALLSDNLVALVSSVTTARDVRWACSEGAGTESAGGATAEENELEDLDIPFSSPAKGGSHDALTKLTDESGGGVPDGEVAGSAGNAQESSADLRPLLTIWCGCNPFISSLRASSRACWRASFGIMGEDG
jgi:hypothetical protein